MATNAPAPSNLVPVTLDTLIIVKVQFQANTRKFKIPLRDLGAQVFPDKLRALLLVPASQNLVLERYSDSAGAYVTLNADNPQVYKTLFRAAKAKLKLRLRASVPGQEFLEESRPLRTSKDVTPPEAAPAVLPVIARTPVKEEKKSEVKPTPITGTSAPVEASGEAPVPHPFTTRQSFFSTFAASSSNSNLAIRPKVKMEPATWVVYCNNCNLPMENEHYHCSICDQGDYDLCHACVDSGIHCPGSNHWMVKRFVKDGNVEVSSTERAGPKNVIHHIENVDLPPKNVVRHIENVDLQESPVEKETTAKEMPGSFAEEKQSTETAQSEDPTRTCNCCITVLRETEFVTCTSCEDYDLCLECHIHNKHGHHPGHAFKAATADTSMPALADFLCNAGRNVRHSAVCDGCEKFIYGVRHKCLNCPDWDFCSECVKSSKHIHPGHRFVPIYEPLAEPVSGGNRHVGIYCDGPLCKDQEKQSYIEGVRFKCAVCNDTDFCANCEAHPSNRHNHTHPLIKFKRPVRSVSVTTLNEDQTGTSVTRVGDREPAQRFSSTESVAAVQTIADVKPTVASPPKAITDLLSDEPVQKKMSVQALLSDPAPVKSSKTEPVCIVKPETALNAYFVRDAVVDGTKIPASERFVQVWTLQNPGPATWPAGCSVRHVGGDNMLNIDNNQPLSQSELALASETNVIDRSVAPGEDVNFRIIMKAPAREGTAISYWRIKTADGMPFGHRLWCDIQVVAPVPSYPQFVLPVRNAEVGEASSSKFPTSSERHPLQNKMEHIRAMRTTLQNRAQNARQSGHQEDIHRRVQEAVERTNKARKSLDEKENQVSMLAKIEREKMLRIQQIRKLGVERLLETRRKEYETHAAQQQQEKTVNSLAKEQTMEEMITEVRRQRLNLIAPQPPMEQAKATEQSVDRENVMRHAQAAEQTKATQQARERAEAIQKEHAMEHMKAVQQAQAMAQTKAMEQAKSTEQTKAMIEQAKEQAKAFVSTEAHSQPSAMIFPQLEKESPASSTHEAMTVQPQSPRPEDASVSSSIAEEFFEDAESVDIRSINSDDGFMTDEEYDILDASDEEMP